MRILYHDYLVKRPDENDHILKEMNDICLENQT